MAGSGGSRERGNPIGPTGRAVGQNIKRLRVDRGWTQADLSAELTRRGQPIPVASIGRIESADRRVEVDDLVALSAALGVSPLAILLPHTRQANDGVELTGAGKTYAFGAWLWGVSGVPVTMDGSVEDMESEANYAMNRSRPWWLRIPMPEGAQVTPNVENWLVRLYDEEESSRNMVDPGRGE